MTPRQYNEMMRQAEVIEQDKENKMFRDLWDQFTKENPNHTIEQYSAFQWLFGVLVRDKKKISKDVYEK